MRFDAERAERCEQARAVDRAARSSTVATGVKPLSFSLFLVTFSPQTNVLPTRL
jgi:hypothetical protein